MKFVAIDIGASDCRFMGHCNNKDKPYVRVVGNNVVFLDPDKKTNIDVDEGTPIEQALQLKIQSLDNEKSNMHIVVGELASENYMGQERPHALEGKRKQRVNYASILTSVSMMVAENNDYDKISLYIAVPPIEVKSAEEEFNRRLVGKYRVELPLYRGGTDIRFEIVSVKTYAESFLAGLSYFFGVDGMPREGIEKYAGGYILSLDIGASTTDIAIIKDMRTIEKAGRTFKLGGNVVREHIIEGVMDEYGFSLPIESAELAAQEGRIRVGNTYHEIVGIIDNGKQILARQLMEHISNYFTTIEVPLQMIRSILVSGGGGMSSQCVNEGGARVVTSKPMSEYLLEHIRNVSPNVEVVSHDLKRTANITGLYIRAMMDVVREARNPE